MTALRQFLRDVWTLAIPYWSSEDRWPARGLLAVLVAMNLGLVYLNVVFNRWNNAFYNTLQDKDYAAFTHQLGAGGCTPSPRNDRIASAMIAIGIETVACTRSELTMFGRMCRDIRRGSPAPRARAPCT